MNRYPAAAISLAGLLFIACSGSSNSGTTPSPSSQPSETATTTAPPASPSPTTPAPTAKPGVEVVEWTIAAPSGVPGGTVLYVEKGCWQCDGPTSALERVVAMPNPTDVDEPIRELFSPPGGPPSYILSYSMSPDGHDTWLTVCSVGYCGPVAAPTGDAVTTLHHSDDGGITWNAIETFEGDVGVVAVAAGLPIMARSEVDGSGSYTTTYFVLQGGRELEGPEDAYLVHDTPGDNLTWQSMDSTRLLRTDGTVIFESDEPFSVVGPPHPTEEIYFVFFRDRQTGAATRWALIEGGEVVAEFTTDRANLFVNPGAWLDSRTAFGNIGALSSDIPGQSGRGQRLVPVIIDFDEGTLAPLMLYGPDFWSDEYQGRNRITAVDTASGGRRAPYLVDAEGDCVNVREEPSLSAGVVRCWADGVILWATGDGTVEAEDITWIAVEGPGGGSGFASAEFLRR